MKIELKNFNKNKKNIIKNKKKIWRRDSSGTKWNES
jgi:hypothetical protein